MRDDNDLLKRWRAGDEDAGEELFDRHNEAIGRFLRRLVYATQDMEDVLQDTFLSLRNSRSEFRGLADQFRPFLFGFAYNAFRRYLRRQKAGNRVIDAHVDAAEVAEVTAEELEIGDPSGFVEQNEERKLVLKALRRIPVDYQIIIHLSFWEEQTNPQIAAILGVPVGTATSRLRLAKARLQKALEEFEADRSLIESTKRSFYEWHEDITARARSMIAKKEDDSTD